MTKSIVFGAFAFLALSIGQAGCVSSTPGVVEMSADNPIVSVGAGKIIIGSAGYYFARYIVDRRAQACWFYAGDSLGTLDCCALRRVDEARPFITWEDDASCAARAPAHASKSTPATP